MARVRSYSIPQNACNRRITSRLQTLGMKVNGKYGVRPLWSDRLWGPADPSEGQSAHCRGRLDAVSTAIPGLEDVSRGEVVSINNF